MKVFNNKSIFISSTFRDMQSERDVLRDVVLPKVGEFTALYGTRVELIDLRWGVDTAGVGEDEQNNKVLLTCLDEIKRSRPFFIGILGDRYGWIPPERVMSDAAEAMGYSASTLEQSVTALEIEYGALRSPAPPVCLFYFRNIADYSALDRKGDYIEQGEARERLATLKKEIRAKFGGSVREYDAGIENGEVAGLSGFADMVSEDIIALLRKEWGDPPSAPPDEDEHEAAVLDTFRQGRTSCFVGRERAVRDLRDFCLGESERKILLLRGEAGNGKSALLCRVMEEIEDDCLLLPFACGLTPRASRAEGLLRSFIWRLEARLGLEGGDISAFHDLKARFFELLHMVEDIRVVAVVDALDQLSGGGEARNMLWVSGALPENFRLLCSIIDGPEIEAAAGMGGAIYPVPDMDDGEITDMVHAIARRYHKQISGEVAEHILRKTAPGGHQVAQNPLYLSLLIQDLAMMNRYEHAAIDRHAAEGMAPMDAIIRFMNERVDDTPGDPEGAFLAVARRIGSIIGGDFVLSSLCMIAASRGGLRERDLEGAFRQMGQPFSAADFSWMRQMLRELFVQGDELQWNFAHESARRALWREHEDDVLMMNQVLALYLCENDLTDGFRNREILHQLSLVGWADKAARVIHDGAYRYKHVYEQGLADVYMRQTGLDGEDFLSGILDEAAKMPEDTRWRVGLVYPGGLSAALFYHTPRGYLQDLMVKALELAEPFRDGDDAALKLVLDCCAELAGLITLSEGVQVLSKTAYLYYLRVFAARNELYERTNAVGELIELIDFLCGFIDRTAGDPVYDEQILKYARHLDGLCRALMARQEDWEDRFYTWQILNNGILTCLSVNQFDVSVSPGELRQEMLLYVQQTESLIESFRLYRTVVFLRQLYRAYNILGDSCSDEGDFEGELEYNHNALLTAQKIYEQTGETHDLAHVAYTHCGVGKACFRLEQYETAVGACTQAASIYNGIFRKKPDTNTAFDLLMALLWLAPSQGVTGRTHDAAVNARWVFAFSLALDARHALPEAEYRISEAEKMLALFPLPDDGDGSLTGTMLENMLAELDTLMPL